ncbi:cytoplasm to vacuole targeting vps64 [Venturia nashicola]|nr:cytoplasm to vacuole targeting vps64 [Venturia nashicola]
MTAVAPPPNLWRGSNGPPNGLTNMSADEVSRMLMPRKSAQRSNSSSSLNSISSSTSSSSTLSAASTQHNGVNGVNGVNGTNGVNGPQANDWSRKRTARGLWPTTKSEPVAGISTARPQSVSTASSGPSASSAISALHNPPNMGSQSALQQQNGVSRPQQQQQENPAVLYLTPMNGTFERKTINVPFYPDVLRIGRQTNNKTTPTPLNGYFDSKVLSRQHAEIWADRSGKIWIRDVKSSNGTFVNGQRLSQENKDSDPHEMREQDMLELGIDIVSEDQKTVVHHKVAARVEYAGFYGSNNALDLNFGDLDQSANSNLMNQALGQPLGQMRRTPSQSSLNSTGRMSVASAASNMTNMQQRQQHFWLTPVNMDKIIQKLNTEFKAAKQQSQDLQRTAQYIDSMLSAEQQAAKKESAQKTSPLEKGKGLPSMKDNLKARFSEPPAPPPQAPLPEKPDVGSQRSIAGINTAFSPNSFGRSDTEKPRIGSSSPVRAVTLSNSEVPASPAQIANLVDALTKAKQEVEVQSIRLREVEDALVQERVKREDAEEKAKRLEKEKDRTSLDAHHLQPPPSPAAEESSTPIEDESQEDKLEELEQTKNEKLQERLDTLLAEFNGFKIMAEQWRQDKVLAEKERDQERKERKTLAELVEQLRSQEAERAEKEKKSEAKRGRRRSRPASANGSAIKPVDGAEEIDSQDPKNDCKTSASASKDVETNGHPVVQQAHAQGSDQSDTQELVRRDNYMTHGAPFISAFSVVVLGVAIMAFVNNMQRGESIKP